MQSWRGEERSSKVLWLVVDSENRSVVGKGARSPQTTKPEMDIEGKGAKPNRDKAQQVG